MDDKEKLDKIYDKIIKLTNLKDSATEIGNTGEANAAAAGIVRLLTEYNLSEENIPKEERQKNPLNMKEYKIRNIFEKSIWFKDLCFFLAKKNFCRFYVKRDINRTSLRSYIAGYVLVGREKNTDTVLYLISFLSNKFLMFATKEYVEYKRNVILHYGKMPLTYKTFEKSYCKGCVDGLISQLEDEEKESCQRDNITALSICRFDEIDKFVGKTKTTRMRSMTVTSDIYNSGFTKGFNTTINEGLNKTHSSDKNHLT